MDLPGLPQEIIDLIIEEISDPCDLLSLRLTSKSLNTLVEPEFARCFPPKFYFLDCPSFESGFCTECPDHMDNEEGCELNELECFDTPGTPCAAIWNLHMPQITYDALLCHAATRHHLRHARSILRRPFPPPVIIAGEVHAVNWLGWVEGLDLCAINGWTEMLALLLSQVPRMNEWINCNTPLLKAVQTRHPEEAALLVRAGVPLNRISGTSEITALWSAVRGHYLDLVDIMLAAGADPQYKGDFGTRGKETYPILAAASGSGGKKGWFQRMMWRILEHGGDVNAVVTCQEALWQIYTPEGVVEGSDVLIAGIGLVVGDTVLHAVVKPGKRD